ncbi:MAG: endonuclease domain-containing protein [Patescibacteria group bacterium]
MKLRRKELRNSATDEEKLLWKKLQRNQLGMKFIRQYSVDGYVVDFYCPVKRLAVEIDGDQHKKNKKYDEYRNRYLSAFNIKVIRFWNQEVMNDVEEVVEKIRKTVSPSPFGFPPLKSSLRLASCDVRGGLRR